MADEGDGSVGYAAAAGPVTDRVIHTGLEGIYGERTTLRSGNLDMPVYRAWPVDGVEGRPLVIVISEAFGLHEHIQDIVRRFAKAGYVAIAPELMIRQGDAMSFRDVGALVHDLLIRIPDGQVMADIDVCLDWARGAGADVSRASITGFCWGARWTWLYAAHRRVASAVAWYGIVDGRGAGPFPDDQGLFPSHPIDVAGSMLTPVLGLYGGRDEAIPLPTVERMREALAVGGPAARSSEIVIYPEAGHAFFADYRESYVPEAARDGWKRCLDWIACHGGGAGRA